MSKIKMRCITCGKWFQSANAKEVTCPDCMQKARKEKMAAKSAPPTLSKTAGAGSQGTGAPTRQAPPPPKPKPAASSGTTSWLDTVQDIKVGEPEQPPQRPKLPSSPAPRDNRSGQERSGDRDRSPGNYRDDRDRGPGGYREGGTRGPNTFRDNDRYGPGAYKGGISGSLGQRPRQPMESGSGWGPRSGPGGVTEQRPERFQPGGKKDGKPSGKPKPKTPKPPVPPKPKREKIPPPAPFVPTDEQIAKVEARYQELAVPIEYDGIRTQIAKELEIPKKAVKKIIKDFREKEHIPSWWEMQTYKGDAEELEKIKALYLPYLPLPPLSVHKTIADALELKPGDVYQAIKTIRLEMNLPQYNDPALHGLDLTRKEKKKAPEQEELKTEAAESTQTGELTETSTAKTTEADELKTEATEAAQAGEITETPTAKTTEADELKNEDPGSVPTLEPPVAEKAAEAGEAEEAKTEPSVPAFEPAVAEKAETATSETQAPAESTEAVAVTAADGNTHTEA